MARGSKQDVVHVGTHKGVLYLIVMSGTVGAWHYTFEIGPQIKTGRLQSRLTVLAIRRVTMRIDRELQRSPAVGTHGNWTR